MRRACTITLIVASLGGLIVPTAFGGGPSTGFTPSAVEVLRTSPDVRPYYTSTLNELGVSYDVWDVATQNDPSANDLIGYRMVIWFTGYPRSDTFTSANEAAVSTYLSH